MKNLCKFLYKIKCKQTNQTKKTAQCEMDENEWQL